jgi:hypothetical protein
MDISNATAFRQILTHGTVPLRFFVTMSLIATPSKLFRDKMIFDKSKQFKMSLIQSVEAMQMGYCSIVLYV